MHSLISAGTAARAACASPLPARRRAAAWKSRVPVSRCAWGTARPRRPVSGSRSPGTQAGHPARASPPAESSSLRGATRTRMRHARSLPIAQATARLRHVLALASRLLARGSPGPTLPLGAERTVLVRSTSSGSVGGAAPYVHHRVAVWAALPLGPGRAVPCGRHCHSGPSVPFWYVRRQVAVWVALPRALDVKRQCSIYTSARVKPRHRLLSAGFVMSPHLSCW